MEKYKCFEILLFGFLLLKESSTNPLKNIKICSPSLQAQTRQFPHVVSIKTKGEMLCQGTLININWVLTSANCINNNNYLPLNNVDLVIGNKMPKIKRNPKTVIVQNDITLIEMDKPVVVTSTVAPIELATKNLSENIKCIVNSFQKHSKHELTLVYWNMVNISKNEEYDNNEWYILKDIFCHKKIWPLQHIIDNGSPLICNNHLYGVYSINKPKAFINIFNYNKWIQNEIKSNSTTWETIKMDHMNTEDIGTTEADDPTSPDTEEIPIYSVTIPKPTTSTQKSSKDTTQLVKSTSINTITEDINEIESDDPISPDMYETPIYSATTSTPTAYTQKPSKGTTEFVKSTSISTATEDINTTESDDPTSPDTDETPIYSVTTPKPIAYTQKSSKVTTEHIKSTYISTATEDINTTESDDPTSPDTDETPIYSATTSTLTAYTQKLRKGITELVKSNSISTATEDINTTESDDPTSPDTDETPIYSVTTPKPTAYTQKSSKVTTEHVKSTYLSTATEDINTTESDDPTSPDTDETPIYSVTTPKPTAYTQKSSKVTTEHVKSTYISTATEDINTTESDDPTSPDTDETPIYSVTTPKPTAYTQKSRKVTTEHLKSTSISTATEDIDKTESDDPTSPDTNETPNYSAPTSPYTQIENRSTTKSSDKPTTKIYVSEMEETDGIENDAPSSKSNYDNEISMSKMTSSFSTTEKYTSDPNIINCTDTGITKEMEGGQFLNNPYTIIPEYSTTEDSILNPNTSTDSFEINDTNETEDSQFSVKTTTTVTITSTVVDSILSPLISTVTTRITDETDETEDGQFSDLPSSTDIVDTTIMDELLETEDLLPIYTIPPTTVLTNIISSTDTVTDITKPASTSTSNTTVFLSTSKTTVRPSGLITKITAAPSTSFTTKIANDSTPKTTSCSQIVSFSTSLITIVCCILYYINL